MPTRLLPMRADDWLTEGVALRRLRELFLGRRLSHVEALSVAERQAMLLLAICGVDRLPVPTELIGELSSVAVVRLARIPVAGASLWTGDVWTIVLDEHQCTQHSRATLAHEFKHVVDGAPRRRYQDDDLAEPVADYFARCLLVPRPWLKSTLAQGKTTAVELAAEFDVPVEMMTTRLKEIGSESDVVGRLFKSRRRSRCRRRGCPR